jgi:hypothetical protein
LEHDNNSGGVSEKIFTSSSADGISWGPAEVIASDSSSSVFLDKPWIVANSNKTSPYKDHVYACWTRQTSTSNDIVFKRLSPNPSNEKVLFSTFQPSIGCNMAIGTNGEVYIVWLSALQSDLTRATIEFRMNTLGGEEWGWGRNQTVATLKRFTKAGCICLSGPSREFTVTNDPSIAVDMLGGVHIVYAENVTSGIDTHGDIKYVSSDKCRRGSKVDRCSWSAPITINLDCTIRDQFDPAIHVSNMTSPSAPRGIVHVTALDKRTDANNARWKVWNYYCSPGLSLGCLNADVWVNQVVSDGTIDNEIFPFIGEYHGITHTKFREVYTIWADSRGLYPTHTSLWDIWGDWSRR